ncbi:MAG: hypothetical protein IEMM0002_0674 [bacterium]|nr:MAG: hypothetical protein IEMM0002_0674 [bacterium]
MKGKFGLVLNWRSVTVFVLMFAGGYLLSVEYIRGGGTVQAVETGEYEKAPDLVLKRLDGGSVRLSDYQGKWVFLNVWATWCAPCIYEMPSMELFHRKFKDKNFTLLAVSVDKGGAQLVRDFVKKHELTFDIFHDPERTVMMEFGVMGLPATYIINPQGAVVAKAMGARDWMDPVIIDYFVGLIDADKNKL